MKRPPSLQFNDKVAIISPAGKIDHFIVEDTVNVFRKWGLRPKISEHALGERGRFSGSVAERLSDLQQAFDDPNIRLVFCSRGGYGLVHLLSDLNFAGIRRFPKWVVGYSDITALHAALQYHGMLSVHAPMAAHFSLEGSEDISVRYTKSILAGQSVRYTIPVKPGESFNRNGVARGRLFGGNLSVLCSIMGSRYARVPDKGILFIEDTGEAPYRVDRMIQQLKLAGVFERASGLIVGQFTEYEEDDTMCASLYELVWNAVKEYAFPVAFHFPVGHVKLNFPLIMGAMAELEVGRDTLLFKQ